MYLNCYCSYFLAKAELNTYPESAFYSSRVAEEILMESALLLKVVIEGIALLILFLAIAQAVQKIISGGDKLNGKRMSRRNSMLLTRIRLGSSLSLSLEFLLAADIAATAVAPSWSKLGQLAAIAVIRTFLNYFLQNETKDLEHKRQSNIHTMDTQLFTD